MNRFSLIFVSAALGTLLAVGPGHAQDAPPKGRNQQGMARPGGGMMGLLRVEKVQAELALSDEQKQKLQSLGQASRGGNSSELSAEQRRARMENAQKEVEKVLTPEQLKRLKEIRLQVEGAAAVADPEVAKALGITKEQREKMAAIRKGLQEKMGDTGSREERQKKMMQARKEAEKEILDVLTQAQRDQLQTMKGKKLDIDPSELSPRGR